jgi:hypothetical protein
MKLSTIAEWIKPRTGVTDTARLLLELNSAYKQIWYTSAPPDAVKEVNIESSGDCHLVLPWYVFQVMGVRRGEEGPNVALYSPKAFYGQQTKWKSEYAWELLHRTPLLRSITAAGRLTFRPRKPLTAALQLFTSGVGEYGVRESETVTLGAGQTSASTQGIYSDLLSLSRSLGQVDVEVYQADGTLVAILPNDRTDVLCQLARVRPLNSTSQSCDCYNVLFKEHPPTFTSLEETVPDEFGIILQAAAAAEILRAADEQIRQNRAGTLDRQASRIVTAVTSSADSPKSRPMDIAPSPYFKGTRL